ncbi:hypothetical protein FAIPA1_520023 [Frankia sp. AiPs1]
MPPPIENSVTVGDQARFDLAPAAEPQGRVRGDDHASVQLIRPHYDDYDILQTPTDAGFYYTFDQDIQNDFGTSILTNSVP